jgi:hypothetical protein
VVNRLRTGSLVFCGDAAGFVEGSRQASETLPSLSAPGAGCCCRRVADYELSY